MSEFKVKTPKSEIYFASFALSFFITIFGGGGLMILDCGGPWYSCIGSSRTILSSIGMGVFLISGVACVISAIIMRQDKGPEDVSSHTPLG